MTDPRNAEIVREILEVLESANGCAFTVSADQRARMEAAVAAMRNRGIPFTDDEIKLLADGAEDERDAYFEGVPGFPTLNRVLDEVFNG